MKTHEILQQDNDIWDLFNRKEEYGTAQRDQYDRFPYYASKYRDIFEPTASQFLLKNGFTVEYPHHAPFAVCLTHDIDGVYTSFASKGLSVFRSLKNHNPSGVINSISQMRSKKIPLLNFTHIMDLEEKYDAKSTFFFMAENPGEMDYSYKIENLAPEIGNIIDRGWEVGLHGGHTTYLDPEEMRRKKERLEEVTGCPVIGYRNHYLRFRVPETWQYLKEAGFEYDTTLGFADCAGFRNGMCHPFKPFNLDTNHEIDILEIPLTVMDGTLDQTYMRLDSKRKWKLIKMLIDRVAACHGVFTLLWHNTYMDRENQVLYSMILRYCNERNAWMTSGTQIFQNSLKNLNGVSILL